VSGGPYVETFETQFAACHGAAHGVACNSGTTALQLALRAAGVGPGSLVLMPSLTMVAVANAVLYCGARPVFVDSDLMDGNPATDEVARYAPLCGAAIVPHLYGQIAHGAVGAARASSSKLWIIQDCAESHYGEIPLIDHHTLATFSFYGNKIVTCGEGGMVACQSGRIAERLRGLRAHAFTPGDHFNHQELAYGYRMTEMAGAVGLAQHERRSEILEVRRKVAGWYAEELAGLHWLSPFIKPNEILGWWVYPVLIHNTFRPSITVERARGVLAERGIETRRFFRPLHLQEHLKQYREPAQKFPVAHDLYDRGFYLPLYPELTRDDVAYIASALRSV
jgi:perosamine synthetase